ncbi:MAG: tRNA (N6-isopentenyl adenosine(37)-C2)-methylthiotransferase MiaB [Victivallales bacterium]|nr:tRNA (N6-isopentenyl adenosine(37)-C2)-methylthiotransferase MiaB [Victivallales bacterium]
MKVYLKTYGCQMNERDSEAVAGMLAARGYEITAQEEDADILIFNTCSVRDQAERKAIGKIGILTRLKRRKPDIYIGIMGCMAQNRGQALLDELPHVDFVIGTGQLHRLPEILAGVIAQRHRELRVEEDHAVLTGMSTHFSRGNRISAYIAVTRGCNRFCSYCIVPYVRGREISREIADIKHEAIELVAQGVREIMLLGQNVAAFGLGGNINPPPPDVSPFADLLTELNDIPGLQRLRFTSPYPSYFNAKLIAAMAALPKVCHSLHLPLQSGSNAILRAMNRHYTAEQYLDIVGQLRRAIPDITFSTDIIVGFPGETETDFLATRRVMNEVGFDNAYIFKYSPRQGTVAATMLDQVPQQIKEERNHILLDDLNRRVAKHNAELRGQIVEVMVEGPSKRNCERWCGRTATNKMTIFDPAPGLEPGDLVQVKITRTTAMSLFGQLTATGGAPV